MAIKYKKEIQEVIRKFIDIIAEIEDKKVSDEDYILLENEMLKGSGLTYEKMSEDLEVGVKNGYSVEEQLDSFFTLLEKTIKNENTEETETL